MQPLRQLTNILRVNAFRHSQESEQSFKGPYYWAQERTKDSTSGA